MYSYGPPHMAVQKHDDQHEHTAMWGYGIIKLSNNKRIQ